MTPYDTPEPVLRAKIKELETKLQSLEECYRRQAGDYWALRLAIIDLRGEQGKKPTINKLVMVPTALIDRLCELAKVEVIEGEREK
jgi:hypothetical protein